jgi:hypothetical protein
LSELQKLHSAWFHVGKKKLKLTVEEKRLHGLVDRVVERCVICQKFGQKRWKLREEFHLIDKT